MNTCRLGFCQVGCLFPIREFCLAAASTWRACRRFAATDWTAADEVIEW